jgi:ferredoxin
MRVRVDELRCVGHGRCYSLVPELFEDDDQGHSVVRGTGMVSAEHAPVAERAVRGCPEGAVTFDRDEPADAAS